MKKSLLIFRGSFLKAVLVFLVLFFIGAALLTPKSFAVYSNGPRQTGEVVLNEVLMGTNKFLVRVDSNGCTAKNSFKIEVTKGPGLSASTPHYLLTINRVVPDECKAIVAGGTLVLFDLEKDLGLIGNYTYSITNPVAGTSKNQPSDESLFSIIEKYYTIDFPVIKEVRPEPFDKFVMDHDYFTCYIPARWKLERDKAGDEKAGIFEIKLTVPEKAQPEEGERYFFPDPLIQIAYYSPNNNQHITFENYLKDYEELVKKREGSDKSRYQKPQEIKFNGAAAREISYEVYQEIPRGPLFTTKYWLKAKFIIIKTKEGFYVLAYKSPQEFYQKYLPAFEEVAATFKPQN